MPIFGISNHPRGLENISVPSQSNQAIASNNASSREPSVTISPEAKAEFEKLAAYTAQTGKYLPKATVLNNSDSHKIGYAAWAEDFQNTYRNELKEYREKFHRLYEENKIEHGIHTADQHYEKVLSLKGGNTEFQQDFEDKLKRDPRMLELMNLLGITAPE